MRRGQPILAVRPNQTGPANIVVTATDTQVPVTFRGVRGTQPVDELLRPCVDACRDRELEGQCA